MRYIFPILAALTSPTPAWYGSRCKSIDLRGTLALVATCTSSNGTPVVTTLDLNSCVGLSDDGNLTWEKEYALHTLRRSFNADVITSGDIVGDAQAQGCDGGLVFPARLRDMGKTLVFNCKGKISELNLGKLLVYQNNGMITCDFRQV